MTDSNLNDSVTETDDLIQVGDQQESFLIYKEELNFKHLQLHLDMGVLELTDETVEDGEVYFEGQTVSIDNVKSYHQYSIESEDESYNLVADENGRLDINTEILGCGDYRVAIDNETITFTVVDVDDFDPETVDEKISTRLSEAIDSDTFNVDGYMSPQAIDIFHDPETPQLLKKQIDDIMDFPTA